MELLHDWHFAIWPPTSNHMTRYGNGMAFDSVEYTNFKYDMQLSFARKRNRMEMINTNEAHFYSLDVHFYWNGWFTKNGELCKRRDVSNRYKSVEDAVFSNIYKDDYLNVMPSMRKCKPLHPALDKSIRVLLYALSDEEYKRDILGELS